MGRSYYLHDLGLVGVNCARRVLHRASQRIASSRHGSRLVAGIPVIPMLEGCRTREVLCPRRMRDRRLQSVGNAESPDARPGSPIAVQARHFDFVEKFQRVSARSVSLGRVTGRRHAPRKDVSSTTDAETSAARSKRTPRFASLSACDHGFAARLFRRMDHVAEDAESCRPAESTSG